MSRIKAVFFKFLAVFLLLWIWQVESRAGSGPLNFDPGDRVLVVAAHPDDEVLGVAGVIQRALSQGADVQVLYVTHGDHNELSALAYHKKPLLLKHDFIKSGQVRKKEAIQAMAVLGLSEDNLVFFGYPDVGTLKIWKKHWGQSKPFRSFLSRLNRAPYEEDFSYGKFYKGENIVDDFKKVLLAFKPDFIFVTAPFDLNHDHQAAYLYLNVALLGVREELPHAEIYCYLVHASGWPHPRKYDKALFLEPPALRFPTFSFSWRWVNLEKQEIEKKQKAVMAYRSQIAYSRRFLLSFVRANELLWQNRYGFPKISGRVSSGSGIDFGLGEEGFVVDIGLKKPLEEVGSIWVEVFGYRPDVAFSEMPKIQAKLFGKRFSVYDSGKQINKQGVFCESARHQVRFKFSLDKLRAPELAFVGVHVPGEKTVFYPLDFSS